MCQKCVGYTFWYVSIIYGLFDTLIEKERCNYKMASKEFFYGRVSSKDQNPGRQPYNQLYCKGYRHFLFQGIANFRRIVIIEISLN